MLKPAIAYKDELEKLFSQELYSDNYFLYEGYPYLNELPNLEPKENLFRFAIIDDDTEKVIGYLAYRVEVLNDCACSFGLYSFDSGNPRVGLDTFRKLKELVENHHRVEWRMVEGNPVKISYDKFCKKYGGHIHRLHDVTKNLKGEYVGEYIYEIINKEK